MIEQFHIAGAEIVVRDLLRNMPRDRWDMEVCVLHDVGILGRELISEGYTVHSFDWRKERLSNLQVMLKMYRLLHERKVDLIHSHNLSPWYFSTFGSLPIRHIRQCVTIHGFLWQFDAWKRKLMYSLLSLFTDKIITVSENIRPQFAGIPFLNADKIQNIVNGVNIPEFDPGFDRIEKRKSIGLSEKDFVIGTVGRISPEKNIGMQIQLLHQLLPHIPNLKLVVVARKYPLFIYEQLQAMVNQFHLQDNVIFTDMRRDVPELLKTFDIFIMTSFSEATSLALLEAMAAGLPAAVSNVGGNSNIITHERNGILFPVNDLDFLKKQMISLYQDEGKRKQLALHSRKTGENYSIPNMVQAYDRLYRDIFSDPF